MDYRWPSNTIVLWIPREKCITTLFIFFIIINTVTVTCPREKIQRLRNVKFRKGVAGARYTLRAIYAPISRWSGDMTYCKWRFNYRDLYNEHVCVCARMYYFSFLFSPLCKTITTDLFFIFKDKRAQLRNDSRPIFVPR